MNNHISFGSALREARVAKGYDIETVARRLRIRPDILDAIEEGDFDRMPPRGYVRNMINAYARLMGLNANDVTRMYLDEAYAYQIGRAHEDATQNRYLHRNTSRPSSRPSANRDERFSADSYGETPIYGTSTSRGRRNGGVARAGRTMVGMGEGDTFEETTRRGSGSRDRQGGDREGRRGPTPEQQVHRSRRSTITDGQYLNLYADSRQKGVDARSKLPFLIAGVVVLLAIIVACFTFCSQPQQEEPTIPVTGLDDTQSGQQGSDAQQSQPAAVAPTQFTLSYTVKDGESTYLEVYVDGKLEESGDVTGPATKQFTSSDTIRFVSSEADAVTVSIDGKEQKLEQASSGIVNTTYKFSTILDEWYAEHPEASRTAAPASSGATSTQEGASSGGTGADGAGDAKANDDE